MVSAMQGLHDYDPDVATGVLEAPGLYVAAAEKARATQPPWSARRSQT
jgi:hypothetical protein